MDMNFDMEQRLAAPFVLATGNHGSGQFDWHGLRARMTAAYASRSALAHAKPRETAIGGGSFDRECALALAAYGVGQSGGLDAVNRTALANGNSGCDNDAAVAGGYSDGD
jgi:hypothetical protein